MCRQLKGISKHQLTFWTALCFISSFNGPAHAQPVDLAVVKELKTSYGTGSALPSGSLSLFQATNNVQFNGFKNAIEGNVTLNTHLSPLSISSNLNDGANIHPGSKSYLLDEFTTFDEESGELLNDDSTQVFLYERNTSQTADTMKTMTIPEPGSIILLTFGLLGLNYMRRKRNE